MARARLLTPGGASDLMASAQSQALRIVCWQPQHEHNVRAMAVQMYKIELAAFSAAVACSTLFAPDLTFTAASVLQYGLVSADRCQQCVSPLKPC